VKLFRESGFDEADEADIAESINGHAEPLSNEDLLHLEEQRKQEEEESDVEIEAPKQLTTKKMAEAFTLHDAALEMLTEDDPILE
jgi:hypothetical protein